VPEVLAAPEILDFGAEVNISLDVILTGGIDLSDDPRVPVRTTRIGS
jgi:hypothetical protein